jgi:hypothetical protein
MAKATEQGGRLIPISDCYVNISGYKIPMYILPDISDGKSAEYSDTPVIGRSTPIKTFSNSGIRTIGWTAHFVITEENISDYALLDSVRSDKASRSQTAETNLFYLRLIQSAVYPRSGGSAAPYAPPPVCSIRCGKLLRESGDTCVILRSYGVKYDPNVAWDEATKIPYKFSVDMQFEVVYSSENLPGQEKIMKGEMF